MGHKSNNCPKRGAVKLCEPDELSGAVEEYQPDELSGANLMSQVCLAWSINPFILLKYLKKSKEQIYSVPMEVWNSQWKSVSNNN